MKNSIEIQNEELIISKFSIENITDNKESFYKVINDIYLKYKNIESGIRRNYDNKKCSKEIETNNSRMRYIEKLKEKFDELKLEIDSDTITKDYMYKMAYATEMVNNMAHIVENLSENSIEKNLFFDVKNTLITNMAINGKDKEEEGIICGLKTDDKKTVNTDVFVIDIPGKGQLSWHLNKKISTSLKEKHNIKEYKYIVDKSVMDRMGKPIIKNSQLLCSNCMEEKNIHNRLVTAIPEGCEDELEFALDLYYEVKNNANQFIQPEAALREACERAGKVPSSLTFNVILRQVFDTQYSDYDKKGLIKWRDDYERGGP